VFLLLKNCDCVSIAEFLIFVNSQVIVDTYYSDLIPLDPQRIQV